MLIPVYLLSYTTIATRTCLQTTGALFVLIRQQPSPRQSLLDCTVYFH